MAKLVMNGIDELAAELKKLGQLDNDALVGDMLDAGADYVVDEWKKGIRSVVKTNPKRSTGELEDSIEKDTRIKKLNGKSFKLISPGGYDEKCVRNAEKAFILHYGKSGQPATLFVDDVENKAEEKAVEAMEEVFNNFLEKEGI